MTPTFAAALLRVLQAGRNLGPRGMPVTEERVSAVLEAGSVEVNGRRIPVTGHGARGLRPGAKVAVAWQRGQPTVAIRHSARRTGPVSPQPRVAGPLVEELFVAVRSGDGIEDVWFRNFDQVVPLHVDRFGLTPSTVRWGPANDRFLIQQGFNYHVMKLDREPGTGFAQGADPSSGLMKERTETPATNTGAIVTVGSTVLSGASPTGTVNFSSGSISVLLTVAISVQDFFLDDEGNVVLVWALTIAGDAKGPTTVPGSDFDFPLFWRHTIIKDMTRGLVLLDTFTSGAAEFAPLGAGDQFSSLDFTDFAGSIVSVSQAGGTCEYAQAIADTTQQFDVSPILVTAANGVRGWVGWARRQRTCASASFGTAGPCTACAAATGTDVTLRAGVMVQPADPDFEPVVLAAMDGAIGEAARGVSFVGTLDRLVWRRLTGSTFAPGNLNTGGADSPGFVTRFANGTTTQITPLLRGTFGQRAVNVVLTDFAYVLDNPAVAPPADERSNYFLDVWTFGGPTTPGTLTPTGALPEDSELTNLAVLAALPAGLAHPTIIGAYTIQVVNDEPVLTPLGRFEELP